MKYFLFTLLIIASMSTVKAQSVIDLWKDKSPTSNGLSGLEITEGDIISNVSKPQMIVYRPDSTNNKHIAIIICPGGGYTRLAMGHEGHQFAKWLQSQGITGVVLKYRMPNKHKDVPLEDFQQAMRYVKSKSDELDISDDKIGVAGFSAGGHLAATASTHLLKEELRPDFAILFYPVITMGEGTHLGSKDNLLGENSPAHEIMSFSTEKRVNKFTPPTILLLSDDDNAVLPQNSIMYYEALKVNGIPATMYIFPEGGHGWGMKENFKYHDEMLILLNRWLNQFN